MQIIGSVGKFSISFTIPTVSFDQAMADYEKNKYPLSYTDFLAGRARYVTISKEVFGIGKDSTTETRSILVPIDYPEIEGERTHFPSY